MQPSKSLVISGRLRRARRFLALAAILLVVIGIALFAGFVNDGTESKRFAKLQEGMTEDEVNAVLGPSTQTTFVLRGKELVRANAGHTFLYSENPLFPEFEATIRFVDGHLKEKHLLKPTFRQTLDF